MRRTVTQKTAMCSSCIDFVSINQGHTSCGGTGHVGSRRVARVTKGYGYVEMLGLWDSSRNHPACHQRCSSPPRKCRSSSIGIRPSEIPRGRLDDADVDLSGRTRGSVQGLEPSFTRDRHSAVVVFELLSTAERRMRPRLLRKGAQGRKVQTCQQTCQLGVVQIGPEEGRHRLRHSQVE